GTQGPLSPRTRLAIIRLSAAVDVEAVVPVLVMEVVVVTGGADSGCSGCSPGPVRPASGGRDGGGKAAIRLASCSSLCATSWIRKLSCCEYTSAPTRLSVTTRSTA